MFSLAGKTVIVTGGGRGLGRAIARGMARAGANVVIAGRSPGPLEETASELATYGAGVLAVPTDLTKFDDIDNLVAQATERFGYIDCLVNNAGSADPKDAGPLLSCDEGMWDRVVDLNLKFTFFMSKAVVQTMSRGGSIVNISSRAGSGPCPNTGWYGAAKAGLDNLSATMAVEWGHLGIRVNSVAPGVIPTEDKPAGRGGSMASNARRARQVETIPLQRLGVPDDMAGICVYFASDESAWVSGQLIGVNGGSRIPVGLLTYLWKHNHEIVEKIKAGEA